jgi:quercetin dioxygenase-like cupin family protein
MITTTHSYGGATATVYVMTKGEKVPRHQHTYAHTTSVAAGQSEVDVYDDLSTRFTMLPGDNPWELPANIDHEIRALTDDTVVVNMAVGEAHATGVAADPARNGGVTLVDAA